MTQPMEAFKAMMGAMTLGPWNAIVSVVRHDEEAKADTAGIVASVKACQFLASDEARELLTAIIDEHITVERDDFEEDEGIVKVNIIHGPEEAAVKFLTILAEKATAR